MENINKNYSRALTIAGSDSGGGAGIQADLKTFSACGCYGTSAITALTAQNTVGVIDIHPIPITHLEKQMEAVLDDIGTDAVKIGMLHSCETITSVVQTLKKYKVKNIVVDPVMVATSGDKLLLNEAINHIGNELLPIARLITPNKYECELLLNKKINNQSELKFFTYELATKYNTSVLLKAGHFNNDALTDIFYNKETNEFLELTSKRVKTNNTHGTGCTLSSAITAFLAQGFSLQKAVIKGKEYLESAIHKSVNYTLGKGHGPLHHFYNFWD
ncbi:bifunctional hydroxymethylpyrimidine kinase/phosphomethylpyrimidine kinase [Cellulophaga baltica]|uniref:bifunctional hydroxymethylpyrimidine kinase/phosphomethylpyrimidine kinase n=1 Tax=Cellulophaga TaxID=104264 RepID=UPI001C065EA1|nr:MULTISPECIES: bifunctional hydroxymethylpyrimidine kinase/phosphomethylpyrimidine kinase [Cellulophaga]MBU2995713.1 bifunctional hydroxymethylpyrimidine kinase/phosphomethylpyrimidine kinase [Cellulophaga baltica]MDO6767107.1 bifunctional hydroxymethylpyrimidine kinase/phosphomethylpyrimidine kinase [Cellulophaga sp. 1_MG-2023]